MIIRRYELTCPRCGQGTIRAIDVPSQAARNNYLPPQARQPVPDGDRWRYAVEADCGACAAAKEELGEALTASGLPDDRRTV